MNKLIPFVLARLKEPSTYVGLALLAISLGAPEKLTNDLTHALALILGGGLVSVSEGATK